MASISDFFGGEADSSKELRRNTRSLENLYQSSYSQDPLFNQLTGVLQLQADQTAFDPMQLYQQGQQSINQATQRLGRESQSALAGMGMAGGAQDQYRRRLLQRTRNTQYQTLRSMLQSEFLKTQPTEKLISTNQFADAAVFSPAIEQVGYQ